MPHIPLSKDASRRAWNFFRGSDMQQLLHDHLEQELSNVRTMLETAPPDDVLRYQADAKAIRKLKAFIHSQDTTEISQTYA